MRRKNRKPTECRIRTMEDVMRACKAGTDYDSRRAETMNKNPQKNEKG